jgi:serine/threonine protein kinase
MTAVTPQPQTYAQQLLGRTVNGEWKVVEALIRSDDATGGQFSEAYIVENANGTRAFLKALDYSAAFQSPDPPAALKDLTAAYLFERDLLTQCRDRRCDRVVMALGDGSLTIDPLTPTSVVQFIIFELGDGDVRKHLKLAKEFDLAWSLRSLHHVATGLAQLHGGGIAHQDLKPSNVMVFGKTISKVGDLGRASLRGAQPPHEDALIGGDWTYAPPEQLYFSPPSDWAARRWGADLYLLGSMAVFFFTGTSMTALWLSELDASQHWLAWSGTFEEVMPYVVDAFGRAMQRVAASIEPDFRSELVAAIRQLCDPDPMRRGHPKNVLSRGNQFGLERFISLFNRLALRAEGTLKRRA